MIGFEKMIESTRKGAGRLVTLRGGAGVGLFTLHASGVPVVRSTGALWMRSAEGKPPLSGQGVLLWVWENLV